MISLYSGLDNDITSDGAGGIAMVSGNAAIEQTAREYMMAIRGEMIRKMDEGMPYDAVAWGQNASDAQFEAEARKRLMQVPGVMSVARMSIWRDGDVLRYTASIQTIYGESTFNG